MTIPDLADRIEALRQPHLNLDEDCWYSCPLAESSWHNGSASCNDQAVAKGDCTCGAARQNQLLDTLLEDIRHD